MKTSVTHTQNAKDSFAQGKLLAIPTETVYGLAAPIDRPDLIARIFQLKERPFFDPLIIHVSDIAMAKEWVQEWPLAAQLLAEEFWPGPLSLVLPKKTSVDDRITSGLTTVAVRCPRHALTLDIIKAMGIPLAAPSANKFGKTSPTSATHVAKEFSPADVTILDGGDCDVGIESTIVKLEGREAIIMRQGMITAKELQRVLSPLDYSVELYQRQAIEAPGQIKHHYMPSIPVVHVPDNHLENWHAQIAQKLSLQGKGCLLSLGQDPVQAARILYSELRRLAHSGASYIAWSMPTMSEDHREAWSSILDRLQRASSLTIA